MKCLALDLSTAKASLCLTVNNSLLQELPFLSEKNHSSELFPLLQQFAPGFPSIDFWALNLGPGSFTGIRASIAAVGGLNFPFQKPVYGINAHDAICAEINQCPLPGTTPSCLCLISDARRGEVYASIYASRDGRWLPFKDTHIITIEGLAPQIAPDKTVLFAGPDIERFRTQITTTFGIRAQFAPDPLFPKARFVAQIAAQMHRREIPACTTLEPVYLRPISYVKVADLQKKTI